MLVRHAAPRFHTGDEKCVVLNGCLVWLLNRVERGQYRHEKGRGAVQLHPLVAACAAAFKGDGEGLAQRCLSRTMDELIGANGLKDMASCTLMDELGLDDVNTISATGHGVVRGLWAGTEIWAFESTRVGGGSFLV